MATNQGESGRIPHLSAQQFFELLGREFDIPSRNISALEWVQAIHLADDLLEACTPILLVRESEKSALPLNIHPGNRTSPSTLQEIIQRRDPIYAVFGLVAMALIDDVRTAGVAARIAEKHHAAASLIEYPRRDCSTFIGMVRIGGKVHLIAARNTLSGLQYLEIVESGRTGWELAPHSKDRQLQVLSLMASYTKEPSIELIRVFVPIERGDTHRLRGDTPLRGWVF